jgi:hypothetical protein
MLDDIVAKCKMEETEKATLLSRLRLACEFQRYDGRLQCVCARLVAISILGIWNEYFL